MFIFYFNIEILSSSSRARYTGTYYLKVGYWTVVMLEGLDTGGEITVPLLRSLII